LAGWWLLFLASRKRTIFEWGMAVLCVTEERT
jgi:hypothetical protein